MALVEVRDLVKEFPVRSGSLWSRDQRGHVVRAVDGVSLDVALGETLGIVGESGCGKTTLAHTIFGLIRPTTGVIRFAGEDVTNAPKPVRRRLRREMQIVFQDPFSSLDPRQRIEDIIREPLDIHGVGTSAERRKRVGQLLDRVALDRRYARQYPHELSGGLRQRVGIATALALEPKLIIADEPTSALDASVQAEILNLLADLQADTGIAYILISHNLDIVRFLSHHVAVMYLGKIVEIGPRDLVYGAPQHPYTRSLLADVPVPDPALKRELVELPGEVPSPIDVPPGCPFHPRCPLVRDICRSVPPSLLEYEPGQRASCHVTAAEWGKSSLGTDVAKEGITYGRT